MGCPVLHIDTLFSGYTPKLEVVRDEGSASNSEVDFSEGLILLFKYYPYGMLMPGRFGEAASGYRYGFQGQEKDDEIKGKGNSVNYKYRMHDPRLGRFFAVDPLTSKYPHYTPYSFSGNKVIHAIELEGLEEIILTDTKGKSVTKKFDKGSSSKEIETFFTDNGYNWDSDWFDENAYDEVWTAKNFYNFWGYSTGTKLKKYLSSNSYNSNKKSPYFTEWDRTFFEWMTAKEAEIDGDAEAMFDFGVQVAAITTSLITAGGSAGVITWSGDAISLTGVALTLDDMSKTGEGDRTMLESFALQYGGEPALKTLNAIKIVVAVGNLAKGQYDIQINLKNGKKIDAVYDSLNEVFTGYTLIDSQSKDWSGVDW